MGINNINEIKRLYSKIKKSEYDYNNEKNDLKQSYEKIAELKKQRDMEITKAINEITEKYNDEIDHQEKMIISKLKLKIKGE